LEGWEKASDSFARHQKKGNAGLISSNIDAVKGALDSGPRMWDGVSVATVEKAGVDGIGEDSEIPQRESNPDQRIRILQTTE
jgi:hypothetical protein